MLFVVSTLSENELQLQYLQLRAALRSSKVTEGWSIDVEELQHLQDLVIVASFAIHIVAIEARQTIPQL